MYYHAWADRGWGRIALLHWCRLSTGYRWRVRAWKPGVGGCSRSLPTHRRQGRTAGSGTPRGHSELIKWCSLTYSDRKSSLLFPRSWLILCKACDQHPFFFVLVKNKSSPGCTGLLLPWELVRLDLLLLLLVGRRLRPARLTAGGFMMGGGTLPTRAKRASISSFWRAYNAWLSIMCLMKQTQEILRTSLTLAREALIPHREREQERESWAGQYSTVLTYDSKLSEMSGESC